MRGDTSFDDKGVLSNLGPTIGVGSSRVLLATDDGKVLECTASGLTLTVPSSLPKNFGCVIIPNGTTTVASSGGTLLNGATSSVTRTAASNASFAVISRVASASYVVTGS